MTQTLRALFTDHPATVGESYFGHMRFAATFSFWLILAGLAAAVHALIPALFEHTAGNIIRTLFAKIDNRGAQSSHAGKRPAQTD